MDDRDNILEDLYVLWVEAQVLHWVNEDQPLGSSGSLASVTEFPSEETGVGATPWAVEGRGQFTGWWQASWLTGF